MKQLRTWDLRWRDEPGGNGITAVIGDGSLIHISSEVRGWENAGKRSWSVVDREGVEIGWGWESGLTAAKSAVLAVLNGPEYLARKSVN